MHEIHLWVPELDRTRGGIQAFSHFLLQALKIAVPRVRIRTLAKSGFGTNADHCHMGRVPGPLRTLVFAAALLAAGLRSRPLMVLASHVNFLPAARLLKRCKGVPYVGVAHGIEVWGNPRPRLRAALNDADLIVAVSRYTRDRIITDQCVPPERLGILPNTFDQAAFSPGPKPPELMRRYQLPANAKVIFSFGRLAASERYKGFDRIIAALPEILRRVPGAYYLIGGTGDDRPCLESLARSNGTAARVIFTGFIRPEELCGHYNLCDAFAMPSTGEGFGIVYLEALACGKPVLAGNRDGSVDALADGRFGALIDPENKPELEDTLVRMLLHQHPHPLMYEPDELRRQVTAKFGFEAFSKNLAQQLRRVLPDAAFAS